MCSLKWAWQPAPIFSLSCLIALRLSRAHLYNRSTAKSRQLLGTSNWPPPSSFSGSAPMCVFTSTAGARDSVDVVAGSRTTCYALSALLSYVVASASSSSRRSSWPTSPAWARRSAVTVSRRRNDFTSLAADCSGLPTQTSNVLLHSNDTGPDSAGTQLNCGS